jgi:hypothetical protein
MDREMIQVLSAKMFVEDLIKQMGRDIAEFEL